MAANLDRRPVRLEPGALAPGGEAGLDHVVGEFVHPPAAFANGKGRQPLMGGVRVRARLPLE